MLEIQHCCGTTCDKRKAKLQLKALSERAKRLAALLREHDIDPDAELDEEKVGEFVLIDGHDDDVLGYHYEHITRAVYSINKIVNKLIDRDGMTHDEATEFFYFNIEPLSQFENGPMFLHDEPL